MKMLHKRCAGLAVHEKEVVACLGTVTRGKVAHDVRAKIACSRRSFDFGQRHRPLADNDQFRPGQRPVNQPPQISLGNAIFGGNIVGLGFAHHEAPANVCQRNGTQHRGSAGIHIN